MLDPARQLPSLPQMISIEEIRHMVLLAYRNTLTHFDQCLID